MIFHSKYSFGEISPLFNFVFISHQSDKSHLPIHFQKLMQWVHLRSHNHLRYKLVLLFQKALKVSLQLSESDYLVQCTREILSLSPRAGREEALSSSQKSVSIISSAAPKL